MSQFIYIDSRNRDYLTDPIENCRYTLNDIYCNNDKDLSIENVIIPCSFYSINDNNNVFIVNATNITLAAGNYTNTTFITELDSKLNAGGLGATFTSSISSSTNKLSITASTGNFTITSNATGNSKYIGLDDSTSKSSTGSVFVSDNVLDLSGTAYIDLFTDLPLASSNVSNVNSNGLLARIWCNSPNFDKIFYSSESFDFVKLLTSRLNNITIILKDDRGYVMDLNGLNYSLVLEVSDHNVN
jgi:hypothetical protein